ncbi:hypothetical protein [Microbacterium azadirachtae]|uniref:hypothetical protein n=1 Tax=Microbacterium azadirachtae TaxID=582680 RepID=UPI001113A47E|nr:hypothetical protein [Microbacterium azadirachtae]
MSAAYAFIRDHNERARADDTRELTTTEVALLVLMAHTAVDEHPQPGFWMKRSEICAALGIHATDAGRKRIQRALSALGRAGAVVQPESYQRGHVPRYRLIYQGGRLASTPGDAEPVDNSSEVWTPDIPRTLAKGDAERPKYGRQASRGVDARHPLEEGRGEKRRDARAGAHDLPTLSRFCPRHPEGTDRPCAACGAARKAFEERELARKTVTPSAPAGACGHALVDERHCERGCEVAAVTGSRAA